MFSVRRSRPTTASATRRLQATPSRRFSVSRKRQDAGPSPEGALTGVKILDLSRVLAVGAPRRFPSLELQALTVTGTVLYADSV